MKQKGVQQGRRHKTLKMVRRESCKSGLCMLRLLVALTLAGSAPPGWATQDAADALLAQGVALLQRHEAQAALLVLERAAFIDPDNPAIRQAYAQAFAALGAVELARQILPAELRSVPPPQQQIELSMGYSSNRRQEPNLSGLMLTLPGLPPTYFPLERPLDASPGPMLSIAYQRIWPQGSRVQLRLNAAPDESLGHLDLQSLTPIVPGSAWNLKVDYQKNLAAGSQAGLFVNRRIPILPHWVGELEAGWRQENTRSEQRTQEWRANTHIDSASGQWLLSWQRAYPLAASAAGGEKRWILGWLNSLPLASGHLHAALYGRTSRDTEAYHPLIANGAPRRQSSRHLQIRYERPQTRQSGWFLQMNHEKNHSNLELYRYSRNEIALGWREAW